MWPWFSVWSTMKAVLQQFNETQFFQNFTTTVSSHGTKYFPVIEINRHCLTTSFAVKWSQMTCATHENFFSTDSFSSQFQEGINQLVVLKVQTTAYVKKSSSPLHDKKSVTSDHGRSNYFLPLFTAQDHITLPNKFQQCVWTSSHSFLAKLHRHDAVK